MGNRMTTALDIAKKYGYKVETWEAFVADRELPAGLIDRALAVKSDLEANGEAVTHALYDTEDDIDGFLILGDDPEKMSWELSSHGFREFAELEPPATVRPSSSAMRP